MVLDSQRCAAPKIKSPCFARESATFVRFGDCKFRHQKWRKICEVGHKINEVVTHLEKADGGFGIAIKDDGASVRVNTGGVAPNHFPSNQGQPTYPAATKSATHS